MANTSSQSNRCESETVPKRPVMPLDIFSAAMKGDSDVLIERLGLQTKEQTQIQENGDPNLESTKDLPFGPELGALTQRTSSFATKSNVTIKDSHSAPEKIRTENQNVRSELQCATQFGDTVLHLLVTKMHNELASKVFERDPSLLKTQNKMLETPLHCAAKVGNQEVILMFIDIERAVVKDVLQETNEMFSPFHIAIDEKHDFLAEQMLCVDPMFACTQLIDGMFPVHLVTRKNNWSMLSYFIKNFPDCAELVDSRGRNLCHLVAEEANKTIFRVLSIEYEDMATRMNNATDYEGNTPLHIAAMKGHRWTMEFIRRDMTNCNAETVTNNKGLTPYEVSKKQLEENSNEVPWRIYLRIRDYELTNGEKFSEEWFTDVMAPQRPPPSLENKWERTQVIGLGSVLITTVTFAAAFTIPGGYNQNDGTPVLERRYMFWAFILANALAFIQGFLSLFALLINAMPGIPFDTSQFATITFLFAASSMVVAFGLGLYVTLAPVCLPIAIILLVITLFIGSPVLIYGFVLRGEKYVTIVTKFLDDIRSIVGIYAVSILFIFCLALLSL